MLHNQGQGFLNSAEQRAYWLMHLREKVWFNAADFFAMLDRFDAAPRYRHVNDGSRSAMMRAVEALARQRRAAAAREQQLISSLSRALTQIGYQVVASGDGAGGRSAAAKVSRTPKLEAPPRRRRRKMTAAARKAVGVRMKAYWAKRRKAAAKKGRGKTK
jgi:hypothetical protein